MLLNIRVCWLYLVMLRMTVRLSLCLCVAVLISVCVEGISICEDNTHALKPTFRSNIFIFFSFVQTVEGQNLAPLDEWSLQSRLAAGSPPCTPSLNIDRASKLIFALRCVFLARCLMKNVSSILRQGVARGSVEQPTLSCKYGNKWCKVLSFHRNRFSFVGEVNVDPRRCILVCINGSVRMCLCICVLVCSDVTLRQSFLRYPPI